MGICTEAYKLGAAQKQEESRSMWELGYHGQGAGGWETRENASLAAAEFVLGQEIRQPRTRSLGTSEARFNA